MATFLKDSVQNNLDEQRELFLWKVCVCVCVTLASSSIRHHQQGGSEDVLYLAIYPCIYLSPAPLTSGLSCSAVSPSENDSNSRSLPFPPLPFTSVPSRSLPSRSLSSRSLPFSSRTCPVKPSRLNSRTSVNTT